MALDIPIPNQVETEVTQTVQTNSTRVKKVVFDLDNTKSISSVAFGDLDVDNNFVEVRCETWILGGAFYGQTIMTLTTSKTIAEELLTNISGVIVQIQTTDGLKQQLLDSGELKIIPHDVLIFIDGLIQG